jgi:hypothetical protein
MMLLMLFSLLPCSKALNIAGTAPWTATKLNAATALPIDTPFVGIDPIELDEPRVGVLLLNLGGPETGDDVEGMLSGYRRI